MDKFIKNMDILVKLKLLAYTEFGKVDIEFTNLGSGFISLPIEIFKELQNLNLNENVYRLYFFYRDKYSVDAVFSALTIKYIQKNCFMDEPDIHIANTIMQQNNLLEISENKKFEGEIYNVYKLLLV